MANEISRRQLLQSLLGRTLQAAGTVVLARAILAPEAEAAAAGADVAERADRLADAPGDGFEPIAFLNGAFRNGGGFRNGAFRNGGGFLNGGFRNGAFRNW